MCIRDSGWRDAMRADPALAAGLNVAGGGVVNEAVAQAHGMRARELTDVLS